MGLRVPLVAGVVAAVVNVVLDFVLSHAMTRWEPRSRRRLPMVVAGVPPFLYSHRFVGGICWQASPMVAAILAARGLAAWGCVVGIPGIGGILAGTVAGVFAFALVARVRRIFTPGDTHWLDDAAGGPLGGAAGRVIRFCGRPRAGRP